ncbi:major capsid protein [Ralstonia nicotianae]|uniref:major capsid protein n=1 Tax=Ralstonia pseudosolanacearum TaxID=1310165 RepID=UPI001FFA7B50
MRSLALGVERPGAFLNLHIKEKTMFKSIKSKAAAVAAGTVALAGSAMAAVPTDVATAMSDSKADTATLAGLALIIVIGIATFKYMRRSV